VARLKTAHPLPFRRMEHEPGEARANRGGHQVRWCSAPESGCCAAGHTSYRRYEPPGPYPRRAFGVPSFDGSVTSVSVHECHAWRSRRGSLFGCRVCRANFVTGNLHLEDRA
jgi:hypothetical protein